MNWIRMCCRQSCHEYTITRCCHRIWCGEGEAALRYSFACVERSSMWDGSIQYACLFMRIDTSEGYAVFGNCVFYVLHKTSVFNVRVLVIYVLNNNLQLTSNGTNEKRVSYYYLSNMAFRWGLYHCDSATLARIALKHNSRQPSFRMHNTSDGK